MLKVQLLISKLDNKLRTIQEQRSSASTKILSDYLQLTATDGITPGVQFIVLDTLVKHFNLYEDGERQQILTAMVDEIADSTNTDLLSSIQIIQNAYPSIYLLTQQKLILLKFEIGRAHV